MNETLETKLTGTVQEESQPTAKLKKWIFVPVAKSRIIKNLDKAVLIRINFDHSTILPTKFKRAKETDKFIYFSLPEDFQYNVRTTVKHDDGKYSHVDEIFPLLTNGSDGKPRVGYSIFELRFEEKEELPF